MTILVTGVTSLIGSALVRSPVSQGHRARALAGRSSPALIDEPGTLDLELTLVAGVQHFVCISSHSVQVISGVVGETTSLHLEPNPHSWSKAIGERLPGHAICERQTS